MRKTIVAATAALGFAAYADESLSVSIESRGGAAGRSSGGDALYVTLGYERTTEKGDVKASLGIHPAGADDSKDSTTIRLNVEREFPIGETGWYNAVQLGYDQYGVSAFDCEDGVAPCGYDQKRKWFGSVASPSAGISIGRKMFGGEMDLGWDFFAEGPRVGMDTSFLGAKVSYDAAYMANAGGMYHEVEASYDLGTARFQVSWQGGLDKLPNPSWKTPNDVGPAATPPNSRSIGIAYVKHF